ncbi:MAG TPA: hypothetical protein VF032_07385 [Thermoleophilaceae bacterium]
MASERGQATIEWTAVVLLVALAFATVLALGLSHVDGRGYGGALARAIVCAVRGGCDDGHDALVSAYGERDASLVREYAPSLVYEPGEKEIPIDYRQCRTTACGNAPADRTLDVSQTNAGVPASVFTHVVHDGGRTFLQYWFYYVDSNTTWAGSDKGYKVATSPLGLAHKLWKKVPAAPRYPGFHHDDWEGYQVELDPGGSVRVRATAHHGYRYCKQRQCAEQWGPWTGWTRVSRGSHAGHIPLRTHLRGVDVTSGFPFVRGSYGIDGPSYPGVDVQERTTVAADLRLIPLETVDQDAAPPFDGITPPWNKPVYWDPLDDGT